MLTRSTGPAGLWTSTKAMHGQPTTGTVQRFRVAAALHLCRGHGGRTHFHQGGRTTLQAVTTLRSGNKLRPHTRATFRVLAVGADDIDPVTSNQDATSASPDSPPVPGAVPAQVELTRDEIEQVGNLVADDEWLGLGMELSELVRMAVKEKVKKEMKDFIGKDEYKVGDLSKAIDAKVKTEVAYFRGKEEYELGDLSIALDSLAKDLTCELTGKEEYELGDLSFEVDSIVKGHVAKFCDKDEYEVGDLSKEMDRRSKKVVQEFTSKRDYQFGDISVEIERRRSAWLRDYLGRDDYMFGDLTKTAVSKFTGKDDYKFGDISKTILGNVFAPSKKKWRKSGEEQ